MRNSSKPIKFAHYWKLANQSTLNKAHEIEITNACTVAFMKARDSLVFLCREKRVNWKKKTETGENLFFKALANRFWLTSKSCSWFSKVVHGHQFVKKIPLEVLIGQQMKKEGHNQDY